MNKHQPDPGALIRGGKLRTGEFRVCLDPDLIAEYEQLLDQREVAKAAVRDSLAAGPVTAFDGPIAELLERMEAATLTLKLTALPRPEFRALADKHPPRRDADDKLTHSEDIIGVNCESFFSALLRVAIVEPALDAETLDRLLDELLTDRLWQELNDVAWNLNRQSVSVPFSPAVSPSRRTSSPR